MDYYEESLKMHRLYQGKLEIRSKVQVKNKDDLSIAYTPGVAQPCVEIEKDPASAYKYSIKANTVAVVSDGSAVLGLGNIGGLASLPVMEGKALLFKEFGGIDAFPICLDTQDTEEIINTVKNIAPAFGGINLEDISAPRCFEIEKRLKEELDIPVFHDDQHGTAVVVAAATINALKLVRKKMKDLSVIIAGAGAAGNAVAKMFINLGVRDIVICDSKGIISADRLYELPEDKIELLELTNKNNLSGSIEDAMKGRDIFIGVSGPDIITEHMIRSMSEEPIIFAMSNPEPEVTPMRASEAGAKVVGTGRSDFPNQINNVLAFPGIFKGALKVRAKHITEDMKVAAAYALATLVEPEELNTEYVVPKAFRPGVADAIADAVAKTWENEQTSDKDLAGENDG